MADCILMQLGSNFHWDRNLQVCNPITKTAPNLHWIKLAKLAIPVSRKGPGVQTQEYPFWGVRRLIGLIYITCELALVVFPRFSKRRRQRFVAPRSGS